VKPLFNHAYQTHVELMVNALAIQHISGAIVVWALLEISAKLVLTPVNQLDQNALMAVNALI